MKSDLNIKNISTIAGVLLILAIPSGLWPYGYYIFLRWAVFTASLTVAYDFSKINLTGWTLIFAAIAFLFNPILPIFLDKQTWVIIDLIVAITFFISGEVIKNQNESKN